MAKESENKPQKELTKKHLARVEKENRQKKILTYSISAVVVIIVLLIAYGILNTTVLKDNKAVAKVGDTKITVKEFQDRVSYSRYQKINTFETYAGSYFASFFQDQLLTIQNSLDNYVQFGSDTLDSMIGEVALVKKAQKEGITVTDDEVEQYIQDQLQYYPSGTPTVEVPTATITYYPTSTLSELQKTLSYATATQTATLAETLIPTETAAPTLDGTSIAEGTTVPTVELPSATETATATTIPADTETATITPTATEYTYEGYKNLVGTIVANNITQANFSEAELRAYIKTLLYQQKVYKKIAATVAPEQEMVWARHILVSSEDEAKKVIDLYNSGTSFADLAAQYSTDTSNNQNGGDLGWFTKGAMVKEFEDAAFALKVGEISAPVKTQYGYHVILCLGHEVRQLTSDQLNTAYSAAYKSYVDAAKEEVGFKKYDVWASVVPSTPTIPDEYRIANSSSN